ncbi:MAG: hypothetical protein ACETWM_15205, partial [Candidatus Lokiarchaeia archaeon]
KTNETITIETDSIRRPNGFCTIKTPHNTRTKYYKQLIDLSINQTKICKRTIFPKRISPIKNF